MAQSICLEAVLGYDSFWPQQTFSFDIERICHSRLCFAFLRAEDFHFIHDVLQSVGPLNAGRDSSFMVFPKTPPDQ